MTVEVDEAIVRRQVYIIASQLGECRHRIFLAGLDVEHFESIGSPVYLRHDRTKRVGYCEQIYIEGIDDDGADKKLLADVVLESAIAIAEFDLGLLPGASLDFKIGRSKTYGEVVVVERSQLFGVSLTAEPGNADCWAVEPATSKNPTVFPKPIGAVAWL